MATTLKFGFGVRLRLRLRLQLTRVLVAASGDNAGVRASGHRPLPAPPRPPRRLLVIVVVTVVAVVEAEEVRRRTRRYRSVLVDGGSVVPLRVTVVVDVGTANGSSAACP